MNLDVLNAIDSFVWGPPLLVLLVGTGIFLSFRLGFLQVRHLPRSLKLIFKAENKGEGDIDSFKALCTALAATVGTGNIVGVATAIKAGGPGAILWMWLAAFFGMATKYAEGCLAVKFRTVDDKGQISGGPMYYIENGLGRAYRPLAIAFAFFGVLVAYFGIGTFAQVNSIVQITQLNAGIPVEYTAVVLTILVAAITLGGLQSIAKTASKVVPAMAIIYMASTLGFLVIFADKVPGAILEIFYDAFHPTAAVGGFLGASVLFAMRNGVARGVFSNESGLGSAPIVAAAAKTKWPAEQGLVSMTGTFIDTIIICTMTGLVVVISGLWKGDLNGAALTNAAFLQAYPHFGGYMLMVGLVLFAFTTILGWNYYGERCMEYLVGTKGIMPYRIVFIILVGCGAFLKLEAIWILADIVNGLMAIPNLIALLGLSGVVVAETKKYLQHEKEEEAEEAAKQ
ncbi:sodium:alanine symporter family protein [Acidaminococcus timonensis]|uniref:alanine/glycine:cation symporter family protein n=2 Tax=Acidaminococcaceae TaxID=909930 RepID=UPI0026EBB22C|nr:sodium:alanine symporter family protein [Acidaminococcus timonensis]MDD6569225.1 sodium:alanine symporter family protein [Acidaminococcus sp.]